jgi:hypothetical protein
MGIVCGGLGVGGIVIALVAYFLGVDPSQLRNSVVEVTTASGADGCSCR